jgi:hypothetical protein
MNFIETLRLRKEAWESLKQPLQYGNTYPFLRSSILTIAVVPQCEHVFELCKPHHEIRASLDRHVA